MFFGPFLPIVPVMILLEYLPESVGGPLQESLLDIASFFVLDLDGWFNLFG